ncbi:MAG: TerC family protein [Bdellovibrionota bacterium]
MLSLEHIGALITLTAMEIVLGIDNIVFIAILVGRVSEKDRAKIRSAGIMIALLARVGLLFSIAWVMGLTATLFTIFGHSFSGRDIILILGGLFLIGKSTIEIHHKVETHELHSDSKKQNNSRFILFQIVLLDIVFSLDSVITAVGMANNITIMLIAMIVAMVVMLVSAGKIGNFVDHNPSIKILALAFLLLIGVMLTMEGMGKEIEKGYIYFAMVFSLGVELLNMRYRRKKTSP